MLLSQDSTGNEDGILYASEIYGLRLHAADESTSDLMINFYNELIEGSSKAEVLRKAKLKMLTHETYSDPFYWTPFILIGR